MDLPLDGASSRRLSTLSVEALEEYLAKQKREKADKTSWIGQPSNLISVIAITLSIVGVGYQFYKDFQETRNKNIAALSLAVADLLKLEMDVAQHPPSGDGFNTFVVNRRTVLLTEADRLATELGQAAPESQLQMLGPEFDVMGDHQLAIKYLKYMTMSKFDRVQQGGWRSIGSQYFKMGGKSIESGREAYQKAAAIFSHATNDNDKYLEVQVLEQWGNDERQYAHHREAVAHYAEARKMVWSMACSPFRAAALERLNTNGARTAREGTVASPTAAVVWDMPSDPGNCGADR